MRVVFDTNILISACWKPGGLESQVVDSAITGKLAVCVSPQILAEYHEVLSRPKFAAVNGRAIEIISSLNRVAIPVVTSAKIHASIDEDDNRFLECAEAAGAEFLITGNLRHYPENWGRTRIVNARGFLSHTLPVK